MRGPSGRVPSRCPERSVGRARRSFRCCPSFDDCASPPARTAMSRTRARPMPYPVRVLVAIASAGAPWAKRSKTRVGSMPTTPGPSSATRIVTRVAVVVAVIRTCPPCGV